jgi:hypothetical protein
LAGLVGARPDHATEKKGRNWEDLDAVIQVDDRVFAIEIKSSGRAAPISMAVKQLQHFLRSKNSEVIPIVVVPYMGEVGRRICKESEISWFDLSGNAHITAPGLRVRIEGRPNRFRKRGRPPNAFAPKSARIARVLLMNPNRHFAQKDLAEEAQLGAGYTSRIVRALEAEGLVSRSGGRVRAKNPNLLLESWHEAYAFDRHRLLKGHIAARTSDALLRDLSSKLQEGHAEHAFTGLAAAWLWTRFAGFRIVTVYLKETPDSTLLHEIEFRETDGGENTWLVIPNDNDVFRGATEIDGIRCVSPLQVFLDLKGHPERAEEAALRLREEYLGFDRDG